MLGDALYTAVARHQPAAAAEITGMLLELDNGEIMDALDSEHVLSGVIEAAMALRSPAGTTSAAR
eukprot:2897474-Lingulodinium_polyedra.AAC.1